MWLISMMELIDMRWRRELRSGWRKSAFSAAFRPPPPSKPRAGGSLSVTCEGERAYTSHMNRFFSRWAHFFHWFLPDGIVRSSCHSTNVAGKVEVTPAAVRCGFHRHRADGPADFGFLSQAVEVGRGEGNWKRSFRHVWRRFLQLSNEIFLCLVHEWTPQNS